MKKINNISYDTLLIVILVCVLFVYMLITLDETNNNSKKVKEKFTETTPSTTTPSTTTPSTTTPSTTTPSTTTPSTTPKKIIEEKNSDAGSNTDGITENSSQDIVQTNDKKTTIVHNHYYGGNKEMAKFMDQLLKEQQNNLNKNQSALVDQGTCTALNQQLSNKSLAEVKNNRFLADLKNKCDQHAFSQSTCKVSPTQDQTSLIGTLLEESNNTKYGSIVAK